MERCFSCAEIGNCSELYVRKPPDYYGPYFPTFERFHPPSSSNAISSDGTVKVCALCKIYLNSQWQNFEYNKTAECQRIYFTKRHDGIAYTGGDPFNNSHSESLINNNSKSNFSWSKSDTQKSINLNTESVNLSNKASITNANSKNNNLLEINNEKSELSEELSLDISFSGNNKQLTEHYICCFVCGLPCLKWHAKTAYSSQMLENKEYFPFFEKLDPPQSSIALTNGATKICIQCEADLSKQWDHYEKLGTDQMSRIYHITNDHSTQFSITNPGRFITNSLTNTHHYSMLKLKNTVLKCSLCLNKIIDTYRVSWNPRATCLCIPHLKNFQFPNDGVMVDRVAEETIICDVCHYFLSFQTQNCVMIPFHLREYKLPKVGYLPQMYSGSNENKTGSNVNRKQSLGSSLSAFLPADSYQQANSQNKRSKTPNLKSRSKTPIQQTIDQNRSNSIMKTSISNQDQSVSGPIIANCHICLQELRDPNNLKTLRATANEEYMDQPYFPFLKTLRANSMKNYEFPVCLHCYYNMYGQWRMSQKASIPIYGRKYNYNELMCTQCQRLCAQKTDTLILRDRLVCIACSENRNSDAAKSGFTITNQDNNPDASNSVQNLFTMKTKTTVTVTPISNELSIPSLASFNYAETMKQYSKTSISTVSTPSGINNSLGQFVDSFSRNTPASSDLMYNSKNVFGKSIKRPVVAAVAPNQRQNTPLLQPDSNASQSDFSHIKMSDLANFPGNYYSHNSAFNPFTSNNIASSNTSFALPMFSSNNPFGIPSHSSIGRKHSSSSSSERDYLLKHATNFSSPYLDAKTRMNTLQNPPVNPFINWQQPPQHQPSVLDSNPSMFPFQSIPGLDSYNFIGNNNSNNNNINNNNTNSNKEMEIAMKIWMSQQNNENNLKLSNLWANNSQLFDEMTSSYFQAMLSQSLAMANRDDIMTPNIGQASNNNSISSGSSSNNNNNNSSSSNNLQSLMANAAMANYQLQMLQMFAAYQSSLAAPQQYPHGINKTPAIPSLLNQFNLNDPISKLYRPDPGISDPVFQNKMTSNSNGFNNLLKNSDVLKYPFGYEYDRLIKSPINTNPSLLSGYAHPDLRSSYQKQSLNYNNSDRVKSNKSQRDESTRNSEYNKTPASSPKPPSKVLSSSESKYKKNSSKPLCQSDVLDLSQNKTPRKSSYAIDSLTDYAKKSYKEIPKINSIQVDLVSSMKSTPEQEYSPQNTFDSPLNMCNQWAHNLSDIKLDSVNLKNLSDNSVEFKQEDEQNRFINILTTLNAHSLVNVLKAIPPKSECLQTASSLLPLLSSSSSALKATKSNVMNYNKCPTVWQFHKFLRIVNALIQELKPKTFLSTRSKSKFMKELGLQDSFTIHRRKGVNGMKLNMINHINSSITTKKSKHEIFWTKWILRNLKRRLSLKNKPHLRRSLMRPVLSGDTEVRFCAAKNKHGTNTAYHN